MGAQQVARNPMRVRFREQVRDDVKAAALEQLRTGGAQAISINAIARQLGVSGPALYRYFANRDELLAELVIDAYGDLARALAAAGEGVDGPAARLRAAANGYRAWALAQPHRYELLYKPPVPGYDAQAEPLVTASRAVMHVLIGMLSDLPVADVTAPGVDLDAALRDYGDVLATHGAAAGMLHWLVVAWTRLHGFVGLEIGGNFASLQIDADDLFDQEIEVLADQAGLG